MNWVVVGKIGAPYGVRGWVKLNSFTDPADNIASYRPWRLRHGGEETTVDVVAVEARGNRLVAQIDGIEDRDAAAGLTGMEILVDRACFGPTADDEYYWSDLVGLEVRTADGVVLGRVAEMLETGANDVLVIAGDRRLLIPFIQDQVIRSIDLEAGRIVVDWDPDY